MRYGCIEDAEDGRDLHFEPSWFQKFLGWKVWEAPPGPLDIFSSFPPVQDQGAVGDCTAYTFGGLLRFNCINNGLPDVPLSVAYLYNQAGVLEGNTGDVGRQLRDVMKVAAKGVPTEEAWPADRWADAPPSNLELVQSAFEYRRVAPRLEDMRIALYLGHPLAVGMDIFKEFESDEARETGIIPMPPPLATPIDGHAMPFGGHIDGRLCFQNQWGQWGDNGRGSVHEDYRKYMRDLWVITMNRRSGATA